MSAIGNVLSRFERARKTGEGRYLVRCSAHEDNSPSLAIRELPDGRILMHCFAGCDTTDVLHAAGLAYWDLYPDAASFHLPRESRRFVPMDVLRAVASEVLIAATLASNLRMKMELSDQDHDRLWTAAGRLQAAYEVAAGE